MPFALNIQLMMERAQLLNSLNCSAYVVSHRGVHIEINTVVSGTCNLFMQRAEEIRALIRWPMTFSEVWAATNDHFKLFSSRTTMVLMIERNLRSFLDYLVDAGRIALVVSAGMLYYAPKTENPEMIRPWR